MANEELNTALYKKMFADLCKYESEDFYREHTTIQFDTLEDYGDTQYSNHVLRYYPYGRSSCYIFFVYEMS